MMPINSSIFVETKIPHQKNYGDGVVFPAVVSPVAAVGRSALTAAVKEQRSWLESLLHKHGAVLFRGYDSLATASDFNDFVEAFGYQELPYLGGASPRSHVVGTVYTANESPPDKNIPFHHEMAQVPKHPSKLFFFCEVEPRSGGETPIVPSHIVYERMKDKYPEMVEKLEKLGVIYTRVLGEEDDPASSAIGRGWRSTFSAPNKAVAQQRAGELKMKVEWGEDGVMKTRMGPMAAIKQEEDTRGRQRKVWFNSMVGAYFGWVDKLNDSGKAVSFGDGSPLPDDVIHDCLNIHQHQSVAIPWRKGDVFLVDNHAVLHARNPFTPPRRILASLCN